MTNLCRTMPRYNLSYLPSLISMVMKSILSSLLRSYIELQTFSFLTLQANEILSSFDDRLRKYAIKQLTKVMDTYLGPYK